MEPSWPGSSSLLSDGPKTRKRFGDPRVPFFYAVGAAAGGFGAFTTRLDLMHWVQARIRRGCPFTSTRTVWRFGYQRRAVLLLAWLTWLPKLGPLPQMSQILVISRSVRPRRAKCPLRSEAT